MKIEEAATEPDQGPLAPAPERGAPALPDVEPSHYRFESIYARGGVGLILKARDRRLRRQVAIKVVPRRGADGQARFEREALLTARLQHPGIVPIYEAGRWPNGESFYAMRLVAGRPLSDVIASARTLDERLALLPKVIAVSDAIAYAHTEGVLHRDLKPNNVVVGAFGEVVVIDWGLAKEVTAADERGGEGEDMAEAPGPTVAGTVVGTPAYMPPEQARGDQVDERVDVYALGAVLYHLLTGAPPFTGTSSAEVLHQVLSAPPPPVEERQPGVPRDLAAVVAKAMARDPRDRYATAAELSRELERFVTGQLVGAHQYPRSVLVGRAIRRHPLAAAIGIFAVVLALFGALALRRILAEKAASESRGRQLLLGQARALLETDPTASVALLKRYPDRPGERDAVRAIAIDAESRGVARHVLSSHTKDVRDLAFAPDGSQLASGAADGALILWDTATGAPRLLHRGNHPVSNVTYDPRGRYLAASLGPKPGMLLWDRREPAPRLLSIEDDVYTIEFSPDGSLLAAGSIGGKIYLWSLPGAAERRLPDHAEWIEQVLFSPDGRTLLSVSHDGTARLSPLAGGPAREILLAGEGYSGAFSPDGRWVAVGTQAGTVHVASVADPSVPPRVLRTDGAAADFVAFSPDGAHLAWAGQGRVVYVAELGSAEVQALHGHEDDVTRMEFLPDGTLLTASADATVRRWDLVTGLGAVLHGHADQLQALAVSRDGRLAASAGADRAVRLWPIAPAPRTHAIHARRDGDFRSPGASGVLYYVLDGGKLGVLDLASGRSRVVEPARPWARWAGDPAGQRIAYRDLQRRVSILSLAGAAERPLPPSLELVGATIEFSPDGETLAFPGWKSIFLVDAASLAVRELPYPSGPVQQGQVKIRRLQFSPDGRQLLSVGAEIVAWDLAAGRATVIPPPEPGPLGTVAASPDLRAIAAGAVGGLSLYDRGGGRWRRLVSAERDFSPIAFSADGSLMAASDEEGRLRLWRVADGSPFRDLVGHHGPIRHVAFAEDGRSLVSAGVDGAARLWDVASGQELRAIRAHGGGEVEWAGFRGADLVTAGRDGTARVWTGAARAPGPLAPLLESLTSLRLDGAER